MINLLGHKFISAGSKKYYDDFICEVCNIRVNFSSSRSSCYLVIGYFDDENGGIRNYQYKLSCKEQRIKNILE